MSSDMTMLAISLGVLTLGLLWLVKRCIRPEVPEERDEDFKPAIDKWESNN